MKVPSTATKVERSSPLPPKYVEKAQGWIDDQFARVIVSSDCEPGPVLAPQNKAAFHRLLLSRNFLVHPRSLKLQAAVLSLNNQRPVFQLQDVSPR